MNVFTAHVTTESADHYIFVYKTLPKRKDVIKRVWDEESSGSSLKWYMDTTRVVIDETEILE